MIYRVDVGDHFKHRIPIYRDRTLFVWNYQHSGNNVVIAGVLPRHKNFPRNDYCRSEQWRAPRPFRLLVAGTITPNITVAVRRGGVVGFDRAQHGDSPGGYNC